MSTARLPNLHHFTLGLQVGYDIIIYVLYVCSDIMREYGNKGIRPKNWSFGEDVPFPRGIFQV